RRRSDGPDRTGSLWCQPHPVRVEGGGCSAGSTGGHRPESRLLATARWLAGDSPDRDGAHRKVPLNAYLKKRSPRLVSPAGEQGFVGGFEGLLFGLLIFVAGTLLATHAWAVIDTKA